MKRKLHKLFPLIIGLIFTVSLSVSFAQKNVQSRYISPGDIDPLDIDINEFIEEELLAVQIKADLEFRKENYIEAARNYLYLVNRNSDDCESYYKLACCYSHLGLPNRAVNFLIIAINAGYVNFNNIKNEPVFKLIKDNPETRSSFNELLDYGNKLGETRYFEVLKLERCQVFYPNNFDPEKEYVMILGLHGNGGNSYNFSDLWPHIKKHDIIYVVPESPYNYSNNGGSLTQQYSWSIISNQEKYWEIADPAITKYIAEIASALKSEYKISKTLILGFSQGAGFAYATGIRYHEIFDGLICFGGRISSTEKYPWFLSNTELEDNSDVSVFIAHGVNDQAISSAEGRKSYRSLKKLGYKTHFRLFEGGHEVPGEILDEAIGWIKKN